MSYGNRYIAVRHGVSLANEQGIILSDPEHAVHGWGLSEFGRTHSRERLAATKLATLHLDAASAIVITSDFRRARETAEILAELNHLGAATIDVRLRERFFGALEHRPQEEYARVWERDATDSDHHLDGCESTDDVARRLRSLLLDLEAAYTGNTILLVSHGDPLQVLETIFLGLPSNHHRRLQHLGNADVRVLYQPA